MDNQTDYEKAKTAAEKSSYKDYADSDLRKAVAEPDEWLAHKWGFSAGYKFGRSQAADHLPDVTEKIDRTMIAAMTMHGMLSYDANAPLKDTAKLAVEFADALIAELGEEKV